MTEFFIWNFNFYFRGFLFFFFKVLNLWSANEQAITLELLFSIDGNKSNSAKFDFEFL